ncbi:MAG TPA: hypothetical protein VGB94_06750 [Acidobacteriaceae bacterium]
MFVSLSELAHAALGYKSLQNNFFYVGKDTIETYGIEKQYLKPIFMLRDLDSAKYIQAPVPRLWLFHCQEEERDLRGTGAYRYIQTMSEHAATQRKQSGPVQTIREALELQGGQLWYAPKATAHHQRLWLRKAFDGVFAPFIFKKAVLVDQRCNSLSPVDGVHQDSVAAVVTSTLFAYSLEINGSASMGAGALEAGTTRLRSFPVFDVRQLSATEHTTLKHLAQEVWDNETPLNWTDAPKAGKHLRTLDKWLLARAGNPITLETLYRDLGSVCAERILVASDKTRTTKKHKNESIASVAKSIAETIARLLESRRFPEDFGALGIGHDAVSITAPREAIRKIELHPFMHTAELTLRGDGREPLFQVSLDMNVAEAIVRALLAGRSTFVITNDAKIAGVAVSEYLTWLANIEKKLEEGITNSALGTGYEEQLTAEVFKLLGINPLLTAKTLPLSITLAR